MVLIAVVQPGGLCIVYSSIKRQSTFELLCSYTGAIVTDPPTPLYRTDIAIYANLYMYCVTPDIHSQSFTGEHYFTMYTVGDMHQL